MRWKVLGVTSAALVVGLGVWGIVEWREFDHRAVQLEAISADGRTLRFFVPACNAEMRTNVEETSERVTVRVSVRGASGDDCAQSVEIVLDEPLGDRELIDDGTGEPVPRTPG